MSLVRQSVNVMDTVDETSSGRFKNDMHVVMKYSEYLELAVKFSECE